MRLVLATRNAHKVAELQRLLGPTLELEPLPDGVEPAAETGETFAANALVKARTAASALGRPALADDSGIEAEALGGRPGVRSARFAGPHASDAENLARLRAEAPAGSRLRYVCAIAHVAADGSEHVFEGRCEGTLAGTARGERGFGYDPVFEADGAGERTMAELSGDEKDALSHRGRAARALLAWLDR